MSQLPNYLTCYTDHKQQSIIDRLVTQIISSIKLYIHSEPNKFKLYIVNRQSLIKSYIYKSVIPFMLSCNYQIIQDKSPE